MGILRSIVALTGYGSLATVGTFVWMTRRSPVLPLSTSDYLYNSTFYARYNPERNPSTADVCVRKVPLSKIKPEYLEKDGKLVERFCAGVWSGLGEPGATKRALRHGCTDYKQAMRISADTSRRSTAARRLQRSCGTPKTLQLQTTQSERKLQTISKCWRTRQSRSS